MDRIEELMEKFKKIKFKYDPHLPPGLSGLNINNTVYLNPKQPKSKIKADLAEEIGHYLTTVGDITGQKTLLDRRQERKARNIGAILTVSPWDIVACYEEGCVMIYQCAEFLDVPEETFVTAVNYYSQFYDAIATNDGCVIKFLANGTIDVWNTAS